MITEETVFRSLELPEDLGRDWEWHADLNVVVLRKGLDCAGKLRALEDLKRTWTARHLRLIEGAGAATVAALTFFSARAMPFVEQVASL